MTEQPDRMAVRGEPDDEAVRILLVEDNNAHAELVRRSLERHHVRNRIIHLTDGEAALDYLFRRGKYSDAKAHPFPHLVLLDLRLPRIDGLSVLKEIKSSPELQKLPVVVLTTSSSERDLVGAYENRANSYLIKPIEFEEFGRMMETLGFYWMAWNRNPRIE